VPLVVSVETMRTRIVWENQTTRSRKGVSPQPYVRDGDVTVTSN
jgi:hypothetical protein